MHILFRSCYLYQEFDSSLIVSLGGDNMVTAFYYWWMDVEGAL